MVSQQKGRIRQHASFILAVLLAYITTNTLGFFQVWYFPHAQKLLYLWVCIKRKQKRSISSLKEMEKLPNYCQVG